MIDDTYNFALGRPLARASSVAGVTQAVQRNAGAGAASFTEVLGNAQKQCAPAMSDEEFQKIRFTIGSFDGIEVHFPPDDATYEQKLLWRDTIGQMDSESRGLMLSWLPLALCFGDYYGTSVEAGWPDNVGEVIRNRIESLGFAGTIELALRTEKHMLEDNIAGGNAQKYNGMIRTDCEKWQELLDKYLPMATNAELAQIKAADGVFEEAQVKRAAMEKADAARSKDEDSRLVMLLNSMPETTRRMLPDGSILVTTTRNGIVSSQYREKPSTEDTLLKMLMA